MQDQSLAKLDAVLAALEAATTVQEIKSTIDMAVMMDVYAKQAKLGKDIELRASEYVIRAERKLGEMLKAAKAAGQITHAHDPRHKPKPVVPNENNRSFTLEEAGISRKLSSKAQKIAAIPKADFEKRVAAGKESGKLTSNTVMKSKAGSVPEAGRRGRVTPQLDKARGIIRESIEAAKPISPHKLEEKHGISHVTFDMAITAELARKQALAEPPEITPDMLSMTAQQKLELAIRQHKEKLTTEFHTAVTRRADEFIENTIGPILRKEQAEARRIIESRKGVINKEAFKKIWACLHPDRILDPEQKPKYEEAFRLFTSVKSLLLSEKENPTQFAHIPVTPAEWEALRKQETERKKAERGRKGGTNIKKSGHA